jgi:hypothetical protein
MQSLIICDLTKGSSMLTNPAQSFVVPGPEEALQREMKTPNRCLPALNTTWEMGSDNSQHHNVDPTPPCLGST